MYVKKSLHSKIFSDDLKKIRRPHVHEART